MTDREFLIWLHERLAHVYKVDPHVNYMQKLCCIIVATPADRETPNDGRGGSGHAGLLRQIFVENREWNPVKTDRDFLVWLHEQLIGFGANPLEDWMYKFRCIIVETPEEVTGSFPTRMVEEAMGSHISLVSTTRSRFE